MVDRGEGEVKFTEMGELFLLAITTMGPTPCGGRHSRRGSVSMVRRLLRQRLVVYLPPEAGYGVTEKGRRALVAAGYTRANMRLLCDHAP